MTPKMPQHDPLSQLRDIHLPEVGGWWPPAPGWWLLALLLIAAGAWLARFALRRRRRNRWRALARQQLRQLEQSATPTPAWFTQLNTLLKQAARARYPERHPEALSGADWAEFLLTTAPRDRIASRPVVEALVQSAWHPETRLEPRDALAFARMWLGGRR